MIVPLSLSLSLCPRADIRQIGLLWVHLTEQSYETVDDTKEFFQN